jgi:signal transduction histidine kinase
MNRPSIALRLTLWYLLVFAVAEVVFALGTWFLLRKNVWGLPLLVFAASLLLVGGGVAYWLICRGFSSSHEMLLKIQTALEKALNFNADAAQEIRTPIVRIRGEAEECLRSSQGEEDYREAIRHILLEAEHTSSLIEELLALARADAGRERLNLQPISLRGTLQQVASGWRAVAAVRGLQFSERLLEAEVRVLGDETALRRVVDVLLDNAFKYTPSPGGTVTLTAEESGGRALISVRDSGIGIADEDQRRIFERFYRVDNSRTREFGGAGLGLSIAQWIVAHHGGRLWVESTLDAGSIFRVELPLATAAIAKEVLVR